MDVNITSKIQNRKLDIDALEDSIDRVDQNPFLKNEIIGNYRNKYDSILKDIKEI